MATTGEKIVKKLPSNEQVEAALDRAVDEVERAKFETEGLVSASNRILHDHFKCNTALN